MKERVFQEGLIYVFTKKKYKEDHRRKGTKGYSWANKVNGLKVRVVSEIDGRVDCLSVKPEWCKCIGRGGEVAGIKKHRKISLSKRKRETSL